MAAPHQYHQPNAPDDGDSDLELDLEELDPLAANPRSSASPAPKERRKPYHELGARIPLRNLRVGRLRGNRRKQEPEEEDLRGLMNDENENRHSDGSYGQSGDEDAGLLSRNGRPTHQRKPTALSRFQSSIRLPSFLSSSTLR